MFEIKYVDVNCKISVMVLAQNVLEPLVQPTLLVMST